MKKDRGSHSERRAGELREQHGTNTESQRKKDLRLAKRKAADEFLSGLYRSIVETGELDTEWDD